MEWVDGDTLGIFLARRANNASVLESLRSRFRALALDLQRESIAHGDIQNDNVMLVGGDLRLIDYDGMWVAPMQTGNGEEVGHKHWQHPQRTQKSFGPDMDRFSFIVVDLSLRALIADPHLHGRFGSDQNIIFKANDYADPLGSEVFRVLKGKSELREAAINLERICDGSISQVPTLEDFLAGNNIPAARVRVAPAPGRLEPQPKPKQYISAYPVVSAGDFTTAMRNVGNRVEIVGRITAVKYDIGKRGKGKGKPYVFVNFGPWNSNIVKLTVWSEGLANMASKPDQSWIGKWVSVTGLIDAPYTSRRYNYTHVGITLTGGGQAQFISETEARYRLGGSMPTAGLSPSGNHDILRALGHNTPKRGGGRPISTPTRTPSPPPSSNRDILNSIKRNSSTPRNTPPTQTTPKGKQEIPGWVWTMGIIAVIIFLYYANH